MSISRLLIVLFLFPLLSFANFSTNDSLSTTYEQFKENSKDGRFLRETTLIPLPVAFRYPETGWGGGALASFNFRFTRDNANSKPSQISLAATFTQRKQILLYMPFSVFYDNSKYYLNGEVAWYRYNYKYFGIGENAVPEEEYGVDYPRIRLLAVKSIGKKFYAGFRFLFENYNMTQTQVGGELASGRITGSDYSRTSALGISFLKDSRDTVYYPRKGVFAEFYVLPTLKIYGSDRNFNRIVVDAAFYKSLNKKIVWANHLFGNFAQGDNIPFSQLSMMGGSRRFRGIFEGKYRDKNVIMAQTEARFEVWKRIGLVGFGAIGFMGNESDFLRIGKPKFTYGAGLRFNAIRKDHINIRVDYGIEPSNAGNFYFTVGEAF